MILRVDDEDVSALVSDSTAVCGSDRPLGLADRSPSHAQKRLDAAPDPGLTQCGSHRDVSADR